MLSAYRLWCDPDVVRQFHSLEIPYQTQQIDVFLRLLPFERDQPLRILDVGCGRGMLLETMLGIFRIRWELASICLLRCWGLAREQLLPLGERVRLVQADLNEPDWESLCGGPFDVVVSRYAIHHLPDAGKQAVFRRCFALLRQAGVFINIDHVSSPSRQVEALSDRLFVDTLHAAALRRGEDVEYEDVERQFCERPDKAANVLAPVEQQLEWLRDAGFGEVDCYWKCFELAILGGYRG